MRVGINTGGGDAPGLNAVIRAVVLAGREMGWEIVGIQRGLQGLLDIRKTISLTADHVRGIAHLGGTILGTTNKGNPFEFPDPRADGTIGSIDRSPEIIQNFRTLELDALISVGGDGSLKIAQRLASLGIPVVGVPKTIDNDLASTAATFGFDTAVTTATEALDKLHSTAEAHSRVMVVELMGRYAGWIALHAGVAASAHVILMPEIPFDLDRVCEAITKREKRGRSYSIVVVAEGARPKDHDLFVVGKKEIGREVRLGGICSFVADEIEKRTGKETRTLVLGHLQRGGNPTPFDRLLGLRCGVAAVAAVQRKQFNTMVALTPPTISLVPLGDAVARLKTVPVDSDTVDTARQMGISFGD